MENVTCLYKQTIYIFYKQFNAMDLLESSITLSQIILCKATLN